MEDANEADVRHATAGEVTAFLTAVLRGAYEGDPSVKERMRAAELLGKALGCFDSAPEMPQRVVIIDDLRNG